MKRAVAIGPLLLAIAFGASACASSHSARTGKSRASRSSAAVVQPPAKGNLVGVVHINHGGAERTIPNADGLVVVYDLRGKVVERQRVHPGHAFNLRLAPGRYRLGFDQRLPDRLGGCPARIATVRPGRTTRQDLLLQCGLL